MLIEHNSYESRNQNCSYSQIFPVQPGNDYTLDENTGNSHTIL